MKSRVARVQMVMIKAQVVATLILNRAKLVQEERIKQIKRIHQVLVHLQMIPHLKAVATTIALNQTAIKVHLEVANKLPKNKKLLSLLQIQSLQNHQERQSQIHQEKQ